MTVIIPGENRGQMARDLLSLTDDPYDVKTDSDGNFIVPQWLADAYQGLVEDITPDTPAEETAAPRKRGRARKEL